MLINVNHTIYMKNKFIDKFKINNLNFKSNYSRIKTTQKKRRKIVKKSQEVTVLNPKFDTYFLHILHGFLASTS